MTNHSDQQSNEREDGTMRAILGLMQGERMARHLSALVDSAETQARKERDGEREETRAQHDQLMVAMHQLVGAVSGLAEENRTSREKMDQLQSEVKTLRSAIVLAHNIGRDGGSSSPLGLDVAQNESPLFEIPRSSGKANTNGKPERKRRNMSPEARARISAAQKARWAAVRGETPASSG